MPTAEMQSGSSLYDPHGLVTVGVLIDLLVECCLEMVSAREAAISRGGELRQAAAPALRAAAAIV